MKFASTALLFLGLLPLIAAPFSKAMASGGESIAQIAKNQQEKKIIVGYLSDRLTRHRAMTTEQIIADLNASAERNHINLAKQHPDQAGNFAKIISDETDQLKRLGGKELILAMETVRLQQAMSSDNYMLYIMNHGGPQLAFLACTCGDPTISIVFAIFLVPFDLVFLPIEFLMSAVTGF